jgi:hypothetical protein
MKDEIATGLVWCGVDALVIAGSELRCECIDVVRGILSKHQRHRDGKNRGPMFYMLTGNGLEIINSMRAKAGLELLALVTPRPPMTDEEFLARAEAISAEYDMHRAKDAARQLTPAALVELRQWIDTRLAEVEMVNVTTTRS